MLPEMSHLVNVVCMTRHRYRNHVRSFKVWQNANKQ